MMHYIRYALTGAILGIFIYMITPATSAFAAAGDMKKVFSEDLPHEWKLDVYMNDARTEGSCLLSSTWNGNGESRSPMYPADSVTLKMSTNSDLDKGSYLVSITSRDYRFKNDVPLTFTVGNSLKKMVRTDDVKAWVISDGRGMLAGVNSHFVDDVAAFKILVIHIKNDWVATLPLQGSANAIRIMRDCERHVLERKVIEKGGAEGTF